jgi:APA family basic amino acid/polyamine antiporter
MTLKRTLGTLDVTALYIGLILGSGIFVAPAAVVAVAPNASLWLWIGGGVITLAGAFCYAECATRRPCTGGFYVFYRDAFGPTTAFVGGWAALLITYPASVAAIAVICGRYVQELLPGVPSLGAAAVAVLAGGIVNTVGLRSGPVAQRVLSSLKVGVLVIVAVAGLLTTPAEQAPVAAADASAFLAALMLILWTYDGWSNVAQVAGEVCEPRRVLPRAVIAGTVVLVAVYGVVQLAVDRMLPAPAAAASQRVFADAVGAALGGGWPKVVSILIVVSTFGSLAATVLTGARTAVAMAEDHLLPGGFAAVHARWQTPWVALAALTCASLAYVWVGKFEVLLAVFSFAVWIFYGLVAWALLRFRRRGIGGTDTWRAPAGVLCAGILLCTSAAMSVGIAIESPIQALTCVAIMAAGVGFHRLRRPSQSQCEIQ